MTKAFIFASSLIVATVSLYATAASAHTASQPVPSADAQGRIRLPGAAVERMRLKPYLETARLRLKPYMQTERVRLPGPGAEMARMRLKPYLQTARRLNPQPLPPVARTPVSLDA